MALKREEARFYLDHDMHAALKTLCDHRGITIADFCESLIVPHLRSIVDETIGLADEFRRRGIVRNTPEASGTPRDLRPGEPGREMPNSRRT